MSNSRRNMFWWKHYAKAYSQMAQKMVSGSPRGRRKSPSLNILLVLLGIVAFTAFNIIGSGSILGSIDETSNGWNSSLRRQHDEEEARSIQEQNDEARKRWENDRRAVERLHRLSSDFRTCAEREVPYTDRIMSDLEPFTKSGISEELLEKTFNHYEREGQAVRVHVRDNRFYVSFPNDDMEKNGMGENPNARPFTNEYQRRWKNVLHLFIAYTCEVTIPDTDFVLFTPDGIEDLVLPVVVFQKRRDQAGLLIPYYQHFPTHTSQMQGRAEEYPWSKKESKLFWRGASTGGYYTEDNWKEFTRTRFVMRCMEEDLKDVCDVSFYTFLQAQDKAVAIMNATLGTRPPMLLQDQLKYKYLASLDGNGPCSGRIEKFLFGNSLIVKVDSEHIEFYYDSLKPNVHYVPIKNDMSDLKEQMEYFKSHDTEMQEIVSNMQQFARESLVFKSAACYFQSLFEEYTRLLTFKPKPLSELGPRVWQLYPSYPHGGDKCRQPIYNCEIKEPSTEVEDGCLALAKRDGEVSWCKDWPFSW